MPLDQRVSFQCQIERCNIVLVPKFIRWQFKMKPDRVFKAGANVPDKGSGSHVFLCKDEKE